MAAVHESHHVSVLRDCIFALDDFGADFRCPILRSRGSQTDQGSRALFALPGIGLGWQFVLPDDLDWHLDPLLVLAFAHVATKLDLTCLGLGHAYIRRHIRLQRLR